MVMISTGNDAVHNVVGGEDVKNIENSKYKTRQVEDRGRVNYLPN